MKIKQRIILSSFITISVVMTLMFLLFYFFIYSKAKEERISIFKSESIRLARNFSTSIDYYKTIVKKYAPSKEFIFLLNDNYFISNLSVNSSKRLIENIKKSEQGIKDIYIFDQKSKEVFNKKVSLDIEKLVKNKLIINKQFLYVYSYIHNKKGLIVFEIDSNSLKKNLTSNLLEYYVISKNGNYILSSNGFKNDSYTQFLTTNKILMKENYLYSFTSFDEYMLGTKVSKKVLFERINTAFIIISISILLIILLSMMQSVKASSRITSSIDKLISVLKKNRDGKYSKIELVGDDEMEYFAKQYNEMIERISNFTYELEEKVKERTKEVERQKEELKLLSQIDSLTGIYNRNKLSEIVTVKQQNKEKIYSIIILDIDDFKIVNDTFGHSVGDKVLKAFANILKSGIRSTDFLGRWGGEEFIIICSNIGKDKAFQIANELRKKIESYQFPHDLNLTASFGVTEYIEELSFDELFILADRALLKAKNRGKNQVTISGE
jgi:diguanylate cyclase (GGDEF)-like protein